MKRGWVIYRTAYAPWTDRPWARFRARVERESRDAPEMAVRQIQKQLEWTWVEGQARLDAVSRERLRREVFRGWVEGELELERARGVRVGPQAAAEEEGNNNSNSKNNNKVVGFDPAAVPRYAFFVQVDGEALRSLGDLEGNEWDAPGAHVKFVDAGWEPMAEEDRLDELETYDKINGCSQENVGWMRISPYMLGEEFYNALCGVVDVWYTFYRRPPETVNW